MASGYACQRCSQLPPPPPMFSIGPPPNILSIEARCLSRPSIETRESISSSSSSSSSSSALSIALGIIIAFLITLSTIVLIKKQLVKRKKLPRTTGGDDTTMVTSSSVKFNRHHQHNNLQNWTKSIPLLSDSCSSDQTSSTPPTEYPCRDGVIEPLLTRDLYHEYEQIKCEDSLAGSLHYYCLVYCHQCANYHPTSSQSSSSSSSLCPRVNLVRPCYLPLSTNPTFSSSSCQHQCSCSSHRTYYQRHDNRFFELQPMLTTRQDNHREDSNNHLKFIEETSPI